jgi:hypothetical protein
MGHYLVFVLFQSGLSDTPYDPYDRPLYLRKPLLPWPKTAFSVINLTMFRSSSATPVENKSALCKVTTYVAQ